MDRQTATSDMVPLRSRRTSTKDWDDARSVPFTCGGSAARVIRQSVGSGERERVVTTGRLTRFPSGRNSKATKWTLSTGATLRERCLPHRKLSIIRLQIRFRISAARKIRLFVMSIRSAGPGDGAQVGRQRSEFCQVGGRPVLIVRLAPHFARTGIHFCGCILHSPPVQAAAPNVAA